jgi:hypothetical protein
MVRNHFFVGVLCVTVLLALTTIAQASGTVTFQIEVLPGLSVSSPDLLVFDPVAPGQSDHQDLNITVWSNVTWELSVQAVGYDVEGGLQGIMEVGSLGGWGEISQDPIMVRAGQPPTGPNGTSMDIPFRFIGSYEDVPGTYSFQVEFTVVAAL